MLFFQHKIQPFKRESAGNPHARVRSLSRIKKEASFKALAFCSKSEPSKAEAGPEALKAATWLLSGSSTGTSESGRHAHTFHAILMFLVIHAKAFFSNQGGFLSQPVRLGYGISCKGVKGN